MALSLAQPLRSSAAAGRPASSSSASPSLVRAPARRSLAVRAVQLPQGVSAPKRLPATPEPRFGFVYNAERLNSRVCMMGFMATLLIEAVAHKGVLELFGLSVGQGLGFEF
jgi:hypothetical protein